MYWVGTTYPPTVSCVNHLADLGQFMWCRLRNWLRFAKCIVNDQPSMYYWMLFFMIIYQYCWMLFITRCGSDWVRGGWHGGHVLFADSTCWRRWTPRFVKRSARTAICVKCTFYDCIYVCLRTLTESHIEIHLQPQTNVISLTVHMLIFQHRSNFSMFSRFRKVI